MKPLLNVVLIFALAACSQTSDSGTAATGTTATAAASETTATQPATDTTATAATAAASEEKPMSAYENQVAEIHTTAGDITVRFFPDVAPNHVRNFIDLAQKGFYNGTKFHRVIPGFMIQGGDPNTISGSPNTWGTGGNGNNYVKAEFSRVKHKRGILSMARAGHPDSASSQFFIMVNDYPSLDGQYSVFGEVLSGMEVADKIVSARTGPQDRPLEPTAITGITIRDAREGESGPAPQ